MKLTKEHLDKVRHIEGFPIAKDEDIIALSQPPYYTACPNPFIEDFIKEHGKPYDEVTDDYHREPFAADVSEGKTDPIYMAHTYHTKVPYKAVMRYILHYTEPGDIVFDGFCGTGMTGVAAQMCGKPDKELKYKLEREMGKIEWGTRKAILNDLSPAATFIAMNLNSPFDINEFDTEVKRILDECEEECSWLYETQHVDSENNTICGIDNKPLIGKINYTIWSDVLVCPICSKEIIFWNAAVDREKGKVRDTFECEYCGSKLKKNDCNPVMISKYDERLNKTVKLIKQEPVLINYTFDNKRYEKKPDEFDIKLIQKIEETEIPYWYPIDRMPDGIESRRNDKYGMEYIHQFYTKRNLYVLSCLWDKVKDSKYSRLIFTSVIQRASKLFRWSKNQAGPLIGTLYVASLQFETSIFNLAYYKLRSFKFKRDYSNSNSFIISNSSSADLKTIPDNSVDYIFTDPPFGSNLNYSELSFLWETWFKVLTNTKTEAVINKIQKKDLDEYQSLMEKSFAECYRILKPGRWMTVEFHNSKSSVWNAIQEALLKAGFIVADVRTLDKKQGSFKQVTSSQAVKQDLIISAYKPKESFKKNFLKHVGSEEAVWEFVRQHLEQLPKVVVTNGNISVIAERQAYLLFDRMVAYHVMNGISVPMDAGEFYKGLKEKFIERDGMYFLPDQVNEYFNRLINADDDED
jgi:DNA modification methylase/DNA-directed RNA polymerase subunit RPC12/RpoP